MKRQSVKKLALVAAATVALAAAACSSSSTTATGTDSGTQAGTLYARLGEHKGIRAAVDAVVAAELKDPEIASSFVLLSDGTSNPGHPTANQLEECLTTQLAAAAGGPEKYPSKLSADFGGYQCRDMKAAHVQFKIPSDEFDKFVMIAAATLKGKISDEDLTTVGKVLNSTKADIVDPSSPAGSFFDAGAGGG
jgi:truncated hemoglobin YjbI